MYWCRHELEEEDTLPDCDDYSATNTRITYMEVIIYVIFVLSVLSSLLYTRM